jgi:hypothetical protein
MAAREQVRLAKMAFARQVSKARRRHGAKDTVAGYEKRHGFVDVEPVAPSKRFDRGDENVRLAPMPGSRQYIGKTRESGIDRRRGGVTANVTGRVLGIEHKPPARMISTFKIRATM